MTTGTGAADAIITIRGVGKTYKTGFTALQEVDLDERARLSRGVVERVGWRCVIVREEGAAAKATRYAVPYSAIIFVGEKLAPNK